MSHKFPVTEDSDDSALEAQKALNAVFERAPTRRFRKERERALSHTPKAALLSLLITKEYASRQTRQLLDATLSQLSESTRRLTLAESSDTPKTRYTSDLSPQLSEKVLRSLSDAQEAAAKAQSNVNAYKLQLEEAQKEIFRAQEVLRDVERQRDEAERKAAEAREVARQMREEQLFIVAREEGRRSGFEDGFEHGKQVAKAHRERRRAIEAEHRRSRRRMIEDVKPEPPPTAHATPASEAPIPVPPPISQLEEPPAPPPPPPPVIPDRPSSAASRSTRSSLRRRPAFEPIPEQSPDVFLSHSPRRDSAELVTFPTQPSVTSSQLGPEATPTPAARPASQEFPMPEPIVMPQPMPRERPRSVSSSNSIPPPGIILDPRPSSVASSTPRARPASVASMGTPVAPPPGVISNIPSRPASVSDVSSVMPYLRMPEPPPSVSRSSSGSSRRTSSLHSSSYGAAPPPVVVEPTPPQPRRSSLRHSSSDHSSSYGVAPPPMVASDSDPVPRQPSRGSLGTRSSSHSSGYGTAPPPPPMVSSDAGHQRSYSSPYPNNFGTAPPPPPPVDPIPRQPSRGSAGSRSSLYRSMIYSNAPPAPTQRDNIPHRTRTSSLSSTGSVPGPYSRPRSSSDAEPPTPSSTATSQLELMNFPNPMEYMNNGRRDRRDSLRDRDRERYITQLSAIPEHLTGSSQASRSPMNQFIPPMPSSPHSVFDPSLQPPPTSAQSWSSITTVPTPSSISTWLPPLGEREPAWSHVRGSSTPPGGPAPEIVVTPEQEDVRFVPPPALHLEHDNFLGPSSARRGLYASSNYDSSNSLDSRRLSTGSTGSVGITIEPPSRPSSVTGGSRPSSAAGHGYLSPNSASMPLPPPSNPQPAPVIPTGFGGGGGGDNGGLPWNFVPMAVTPSQQNAPLDPSGGSGRPYSPYAPPMPSSSEAPVIPSMGGGGGKSKSKKKQKQKQKAQSRETYAAAPTPPGFSYPAPLGVGAATPGSGSYLRGLPKQKQRRRDEDDSDSGSVSTDGSESDEVGITIIPPPETRPVHVGGKGRRVAFS